METGIIYTGKNYGPDPGNYINSPLVWKYDHYPDTYRTMATKLGVPETGPDKLHAPTLDEVNGARDEADEFYDKIQGALKKDIDPKEHMGDVSSGYLPVISSTDASLSAFPAVLPPGEDPDEDDWEDGGDLTGNTARLHLANLRAKGLALTAGYLQWQMFVVCVAHMLLKLQEFGKHGGRKRKATS